MDKNLNMDTYTVHVGDVVIGGKRGDKIVVQTMCNTHTYDVQETAEQCERLWKAGSEIIRITVPGLNNIKDSIEIKKLLKERGVNVPLVADIHFSSATALEAAKIFEKVRINPGNFHRDHQKAREQFAKFLDVCKEYGTAVRIGLNHGSLGAYITNLYGNTPNAMAKAAMEWIEMCLEKDFKNVVVSLKSSNTLVMVEAYRLLAAEMRKRGILFPFHVGVTESGNGDSGRIKSCVGISALLSEGIGDTIRVSLTEDPENELPVAKYLADRYSGQMASSLINLKVENGKAIATYRAPSRDKLLFDASCDLGKPLLDHELDEIEIRGTYMADDSEVNPSHSSSDDLKTSIKKEISIEESGLGAYLSDEIMQAARRRFYKPEYIACPGCGRTMYNLQDAFEEVKAKTGHLKNVVIAVMGCIVNGPGEMADADWGYVGEGNKKVSIYHKKEPILRHIPEDEAVDKLLKLIEEDQKQNLSNK